MKDELKVKDVDISRLKNKTYRLEKNPTKVHRFKSIADGRSDAETPHRRGKSLNKVASRNLASIRRNQSIEPPNNKTFDSSNPQGSAGGVLELPPIKDSKTPNLYKIKKR